MFNLNRRSIVQALGAYSASPFAIAQNAYPNKPVTLIVPQPPGGDADAFCRLLQPKMQEALGQSLVIDNRAGAAGNIGTALGARATPDGYTMTFVNQGTMAINPHLYPSTGYTLDQFVPVSHLASVDLVICAHHSVKANNLRELLDLVRKAPGTYNYGTAGSGSANHLAGELLKSAAKVFMTHIPFRGGGPAIASALAGDIQIVVAFPLSALPHIKAGKLRALAVTGAKRATALPDVPTVAESGVPGYEFSSWFGMVLPKGVPQDIVNKVQAAAAFALKNPDVENRLLAGMTRAVASDGKSFTDLIAKENAQWSKMIASLKIKID